MRVALVLGASVGGIGTYVRELAEHCVTRGDEVVVLGPQSTENHFAFTTTGARFVPATGLRTLRRVLADADPDVVHSHGFKAAATTNLACVARRHKPRRVVTLHNAILATGLRARISGVIERLAVRPADAVLGASADLVQRATELGAKHAALVPVPAPPLPDPTRTPAETRSNLGVHEEHLLLAVGRLAPQKSLPLLLDAIAALDDVPLRLVIAGDGPERDTLAARIKAEKLPVTPLGHQSPADIANLLAAADAFVLSSQWEARALVIQEALRAAVPVIATAVGAIPDLVADAARLVPPNNAPALAAAIRAVLTTTTEPELRERLRAAGPAQAATWPTSAEALESARAWYTGTPSGRSA
jgi:glycosyltransferase involved in cell wall biosynthesis